MKNQRGVTLIALVVTIIVLIILAGIAIVTLMGDNGVITRSKQAKQEQIEGEVRDSITLAIQSAKMQAELKAVSSPSFSAQSDLIANSTTNTNSDIYKAIDDDLSSDYTITAATGTNETVVTIEFTNGAYKQATNYDQAKITVHVHVVNNSLTIGASDWDYIRTEPPAQQP